MPPKAPRDLGTTILMATDGADKREQTPITTPGTFGNARLAMKFVAQSLGFAATLVLWHSSVTWGQNPEASEAELAKRKLSVERGCWVCPLEKSLRGKYGRLDALERAQSIAKETYGALAEPRAAALAQLVPWDRGIEKTRGQLAASNLTPLQRQNIEQQLQRLEQQAEPVRKRLQEEWNADDERSAFSRATAELVEREQALALSALEIRRDVTRLGARYAQLAADPQVVAALAQLEPKRLGPSENYDAKYINRVDRITGTSLGEGVPIRRQLGKFRIPAIVNDEAAVTLTHTGSQGKLLLPTSSLASAGLAADEKAPSESIDIDGRRLTVRQVTLERLRFGRLVIFDVPAWILPPDAEDLGGRVSDESLAGHSPQLDAQRLWFRVRGEKK